jgi:catechol 2,3-dioxygenase-like lactoylglutathione lyase family enzyme
MLSAMAAAVTTINHVSVSARDLEASVAFYADVLGATRVATPDFGLPVQWLAIGDAQLHLFQAPVEPPSHQHFALTVPDLEPVYRRAEARGAFDHDAFGSHLVALPGDVCQTYLRDPAGNLVELDTPGASALPEAIRARMVALADMRPQSPENLAGRLALG